MDSEITTALRNIAAGFDALALALENQQKATEERMCCIETKAYDNNQTLRDVANMILNRL